MADSILAQSLVKFAAPTNSQTDSVYKHPFLITLDGSIWAVALDIPSFVGVKGKASYPTFDGNPLVHDCVKVQTDKWEEVDLTLLKEWCGPQTVERDEAVVNGKVFNRSLLGRLLAPFPFPKARLGLVHMGKIPSLLVESPNKWRVLLAALDCEPESGLPVWGKDRIAESQLFDLAMELE